MTNTITFKDWLNQGGVQPKARNTRDYAIRTIEKNLDELGMPFQRLEDAWKADRFQSLRDRLRDMREDAKKGGQDYRILMPNSDKPVNRLSSWNSWLAQYGRFLGGDPPGSVKDADRIRQYVLEHYIEPARKEGRKQAEVLVREVNAALNLNEAWPNICQALTRRKFQKLAQVPPPERIGADQSSTTVFRFDLSSQLMDRSVLHQLRDRFLAACPDFESFVNAGTGWAKDEKAYKVVASERVNAALAEGGSDEALGEAVFKILKTAAKDGPLVRWQTEDSIAKEHPELIGEFHGVIGRLIRSDLPVEEALSQAFDAFAAIRARGAAGLTYGERLNILFSALAMVRPSEVAPLKITRFNDIWQELTGEKLFVQSTADMVSDYRRFSAVFSEIFNVMHDDWQWQPQDWLDIQGFLWIAADDSTDINETPEGPVPIIPTNLILYGPPGTES